MYSSWTPVQEAISRRQDLCAQLHAEHTDAYRLFHGATEGIPGFSIDRYGPLVLAQSFRQALSEAERDALEQTLHDQLVHDFHFVYNHRGDGPHQDFSQWHQPSPKALAESQCHEQGLLFLNQARHRGIDPLFFLDLRVGRRFVRAQAQGKRVLNLCAYTCTLGIAAAAGGASEIWNVDFAESSLDVGRRSAQANQLDGPHHRFIQQDMIPVIRQLAGLPIKGRGRKRRYERFDAQQFDIVFLDPPRWSKGPFGAIDLVRDYQSLFKPSLLATAPGGLLIAVNNVAQVDRDTWLDQLQRCAAKAGRPLRDLQVLQPEFDFPSPDGNPPLKIAVCAV